ncbi:hypothetical protein [Hyphomicrobium sp. LHD-15]|uniref:hypothetical protein n=1 Tax=Hyphomicrobium sp. LHD-15 TaxID=3072142 RepID=UPI00280E74A7|nr:hypothetical protein [Hyphomicrobium sp. LHD-15]MDQ8700534.1 hypothetical protein [Hyphomicrobium sp. LHD-15]
MNRTILASALALISATTFFASAAEACISCNYVPEVVNTPSPHDAKRFQKKRVIVAQPQRAAPSKQRIAKSAPAAKKVETAKAAEPKSIETAKADIPSESKTISTAALLEDGDRPAQETQEVAQDVGCKKFFPTIGQTLTVPCQ